MNSPVMQIILEAITKVSADKTLFYHVSSLTVLAYLPTGNSFYVSKFVYVTRFNLIHLNLIIGGKKYVFSPFDPLQ